MSPLPTRTEGKVAAGLLVVFYAALLPPGLLLANESTLVFGQSLMYVWSAVWGVFGILVLVYAARTDAFAITESQVPPELREQEDVATATDLEEPTRGEA
ncbi:hypothetical protein [Natrononativus amylolyticus]|uniref:hypothetical protein n=1 Tax=Natrononativus amylolyticus TaxID=2963434 RepID=UPI0020CDBF1F|nr:hypothetical protein [Natrononativus amylolyticus]